MYNLFTLWPSIHSHTRLTQTRTSLEFIHILNVLAHMMYSEVSGQSSHAIV